tara:strand:+ start:1169 stop:1396 length:228 start_codon:yes stop_codon:yes gene_type:complete
MSVLRKKTQVTKNYPITDRRNQETILLQQEEIYTLRSVAKEKDVKFTENIKILQQHNSILLKMIEQQQKIINKNL